MALNIEYEAETEEDMAGLADSLLKAGAISRMGEFLLHKNVTDEFYELSYAFQTIRLLIEPAISFFSYEGLQLIQEKQGKKKRPSTTRAHKTTGALRGSPLGNRQRRHNNAEV